ncbi:matrixin family metalloprotease [Nocardioides szechwanensis]|uniref:matrixin family metalloprotease n=1 Tax=Nocardioides szechwanensis TaxID=1005944 RepID=UPI000B8864FB|nr:matrixin family metalloprotease [Nocardioides szechwanensis]
MGGFRRSRRRAEEQWQRELLREIRALETTDDSVDVGLDGGTVTPIRGPLPKPPRSRPPRRERVGRVSTDRRRTFATVGVTACVVVALALFNLSPGAAQVRQWLGIGADRLGAAVDGDGRGDYAFLATRRGTDQPIGWSPCDPIEYVVNPDGAPDDWEDLVDEAVTTISEATGLLFDYGGETDDRDFEGRFGIGGRPEPVLVGWADEDEVSGLAGDVAGLAGPMSRGNGLIETYVTGRVVLDQDAFEDLEPAIGTERKQRAIIVHELGHLVGLDHVDDPDELMYAETGVTELGPGDRSGLAILGDTPCA